MAEVVPQQFFAFAPLFSSSVSNFAKLICAILRGEVVAWPHSGDAGAAARFVTAARFHGVLPLLDERLEASAESWPIEVIEACRKNALFETMLEVRRRAELVRVIETLARAQAAPLVLKGGALAYTHYPHPALRPRSDTDLLIAPESRRRADEALQRLGYTDAGGVTGEFVSYQMSWSREDGAGPAHHLDVHWRINNSQILAKLLSHAECEASATPIAALGPCARGLGPVHAALFACMHRAGHCNAPIHVDGVAHDACDRLIWLYDVHLLCSRMAPQEIAELAGLAEEKRLRAVCLDALERCGRGFATPIPSEILRRLAEEGPTEPSALYLGAGPARRMLGDLMAIESLTDRLRWLGELAFPSARYMRQKYPESPGVWLPLLYARRGAAGLWRLTVPSRDGRPH